MAPRNKSDLDLCPGSPEDSTHAWVLDPPPGRNSFRIVVCGQRTSGAPTSKPRARFRYLGALVHGLLPMLAFWRTGN